MTATESRAREPHPTFDSTIGRTLYVADLMTRGHWVSGETAHDLAEDWGLAKSTVENYSSEASRWLKTLVDPEPVREKLAYRLTEALDDARGQPRNVAEVAKAYMPLVGIGDKGTVIQQYFDQRTGNFSPAVMAGLRQVVRLAAETAVAAYDVTPGLRGEAVEAGVDAAERVLGGGVAGLLGAKGE